MGIGLQGSLGPCNPSQLLSQVGPQAEGITGAKRGGDHMCFSFKLGAFLQCIRFLFNTAMGLHIGMFTTPPLFSSKTNGFFMMTERLVSRSKAHAVNGNATSTDHRAVIANISTNPANRI